MKKLFLFSFVCFSVAVQAQFLSAAGAGNNVLMEKNYTEVDGSPYLYQEWKSGAIRDKSGRLSENLMIRYDSYRDEVQFLKDGKTLVVEPGLASEFYFVVLNNDTKKIENLVFRNGFGIEGYTTLNYFQIIYQNKVQYVKKVKTDYLEETVNNFGTNEQVKKFLRTESEFLIIDGSALKVSKGRKDLLKHFGSFEGQIKSYIKENKYNVKDDSDLIRILKKYEELKG